MDSPFFTHQPKGVMPRMGTTSKALTLLTYFTRQQPSIGLSDMARLSGMNKATVHRLLSELAEHGFVEQLGAGRAYRLGPAVLRLAALRDHHVPMRDMAIETLTKLNELTGETAHMSLLNAGILSSYAYTYATTHSTMVTMEDAEVLDLHATGSGLAVLAHSSDAFIQSTLSRPLPRAHRRQKQTPSRSAPYCPRSERRAMPFRSAAMSRMCIPSQPRCSMRRAIALAQSPWRALCRA